MRTAKLAGEAALAREAERDGVLAETHLASQARLQGQIALRELRQRAAQGSGGSILPELLGAHDRLAKEQTKSLPLELRRRVESKLGEVRSWLEGQGAVAEQALGEDRRRRMVDQRLKLGEALLAQEPESYEIATSELESLADGLSLKGQRRRDFLSAAQARAAEAALKGHLELNPQDGLEDLERGRFGAALKTDQAEPWRKLLTNAQRFRSGVAEAETRLAATQERRALTQTLEQASRNEAPLPTLELIERHQPGRGPEILAAIEAEAQRQAMIGELLQRGPEEEERWLAEAGDAAERQRRQEALNLKRQRLQAEPERFLALYDGQLAQALERAAQDPATHLKQAIQLYGQAWARHRIGQKPGAALDPDQAAIAEPHRPQVLDPKQAVIAEPHRILPRVTLTELAEQFRSQGDAPKRLTWMTALDKSLGAQTFDRLIADWRKIPDAIPPGLEALIGKAREGAPASMLALQLDALEAQEREGFLRLVSDGGGAAKSPDPITGVSISDSIAGANELEDRAIAGHGGGNDTIDTDSKRQERDDRVAESSLAVT